MKNTKVIVSFLCLLLVVFLSIIVFNYDFDKTLKNKEAVDTFKNNVDEECDRPIILSWNNVNSINTTGGKMNITIFSKLKNNTDAVENVAYVMEWKKSDKDISENDITLIYKDKELKGYKGKYQIIKESKVKNDKTYTVSVIFKKKGAYNLRVYAENYKE
ncbi:hypothetical protein [Clostridium ganghwense]|uniref:DUF5067 domain-containing protein n=1 Tax=Clostridium ganghwense TaxID=312089 RepID=A0ABT4CSL3_9CLOT|nr:hypothetical protein [Clostridium ganghwense]MCY6370964.1 hypothetical protein [Clostridium ganghwense]